MIADDTGMEKQLVTSGEFRRLHVAGWRRRSARDLLVLFPEQSAALCWTPSGERGWLPAVSAQHD